MIWIVVGPALYLLVSYTLLRLIEHTELEPLPKRFEFVLYGLPVLSAALVGALFMGCIEGIRRLHPKYKTAKVEEAKMIHEQGQNLCVCFLCGYVGDDQDMELHMEDEHDYDPPDPPPPTDPFMSVNIESKT